MDALVAAVSEIVDESLTAMRGVVASATPESLNRRPGGEDTNSIAVLVVHSLNSTRWWLSIAAGTPLPRRDRPVEFREIADDAGGLLMRFDEIAADCRALLDTNAPFDAGASRVAPSPSPGGRPDAETVTAAWALVHAAEHLREHVAQAELTSQLFAGR